MENLLATARSSVTFVRSAPAHSSLLPPCGSGKKQTRNMASVAASLGPAGMKPNGVELVENGLDLKASCPG
jgi:hypothetical protein